MFLERPVNILVLHLILINGCEEESSPDSRFVLPVPQNSFVDNNERICY